MKYFLTMVISVMTGLSISAQYAKHKDMPDKSKPVVSDFNDLSYKFSTTITSRDIKEHIFTLASDAYEGRETGTEGNTKAAHYIADKFKSLGLPAIGNDNGYFQPVSFTFTSWDQLSLLVNGQGYKLLRDFIAFPQESKKDEIVTDEITFLGYGIQDTNYDDYAGADVKGKVIMVYDGEPTLSNGISMVSNSSTLSKWSSDWKLKSATAKKNGVKLMLVISNDLKTLIADNRRQLVNRVTQLGNFPEESVEGVNTIFISSTLAETILEDNRNQIIEKRDALKQGNGGQIRTTVKVDIGSKFLIKRQILEGQNVLGLIEGTDKKDEIVIVSGHYDHVGMKGDEVYNGADDNASGTTAVLEIAEALATAKKMKQGPRRSVLCLLVTGEEKGLLGSEYYAANPIFPIENTTVDVNIDMIGRWGEEYSAQDQPYNYVIGSDRLSTDLHKINTEMNQKYSQLLLDYKYNDEADPNRFYFRSDHYNFAKMGIPAIFFFNGVHKDYHRLTDTPDKIDIPLMRHRAAQIFHTVWELANRNDRIRVDGVVK